MWKYTSSQRFRFTNMVLSLPARRSPTFAGSDASCTTNKSVAVCGISPTELQFQQQRPIICQSTLSPYSQDSASLVDETTISCPSQTEISRSKYITTEAATPMAGSRSGSRQNRQISGGILPEPACSDAGVFATSPTTPLATPTATITHAAEEAGRPRRILYIVTSLAEGDWNAFAPEKWAYLQKNCQDGVDTDIYMLAFIKRRKLSEQYNGTYYTTKDPVTGEKTFSKLNDIAAWDGQSVKKLVAEYHEEGNTHLVIGTHGMGDYFWLDYYTEDGGLTIQVAKEDDPHSSIHCQRIIHDQFQGKQFLSTILDCCLMGELYTMKHFNAITPFVGCGEGFMWAEDTDLNGTMFSATAAIALSDPKVDTYTALLTAGEYCMRQSKMHGRNDFGIYATEAADPLLSYIKKTPRYNNILQDTRALIRLSENTTFSPYCFYTVNGDIDTYDAQYLLNIHQISTDHPKDKKLARLLKSVVQWHEGPTCGFGPETAGKYNFQLCGLSVTCAHSRPSARARTRALLKFMLEYHAAWVREGRGDLQPMWMEWALQHMPTLQSANNRMPLLLLPSTTASTTTTTAQEKANPTSTDSFSLALAGLEKDEETQQAELLCRQQPESQHHLEPLEVRDVVTPAHTTKLCVRISLSAEGPNGGSEPGRVMKWEHIGRIMPIASTVRVNSEERFEH